MSQGDVLLHAGSIRKGYSSSLMCPEAENSKVSFHLNCLTKLKLRSAERLLLTLGQHRQAGALPQGERLLSEPKMNQTLLTQKSFSAWDQD